MDITERYLTLSQQVETLKAVIVRQQQDHQRLMALLVLAYGGEAKELRVGAWDWEALAREGRVTLVTTTDAVTGERIWRVEAESVA